MLELLLGGGGGGGASLGRVLWGRRNLTHAKDCLCAPTVPGSVADPRLLAPGWGGEKAEGRAGEHKVGDEMLGWKRTTGVRVTGGEACPMPRTALTSGRLVPRPWTGPRLGLISDLGGGQDYWTRVC